MSKCSWPMKKIGDIFEVQLGKMLNKKAKEGELFPYLANFNVRWGAFDFSRLNEMAFSEKERKKFSLQPDDLLMCEGGEIGRCAVWEGTAKPIYYQKALHRLRPLSNSITSKFIYYYMQHIASKGELPKLVGETSIAHLTREKLLCLRVPFPPFYEQTAIADLLSTWDAAIEKTGKLIAAKEKQLNALYQLFFQPGTRTNSSWSNTKIGQFMVPRKERALPSRETPLFSLTIEDGVTPKTDRYNRDFLVKDNGSKTYKVVYPGDIVFNPSNLRWGAIARSHIKHKVVISPIYEVLEIKADKVDPVFLEHALTCPRQIGIFATRTEGTLIERMAVKLDAFLLTEIMVPPNKKGQQEVASFLNLARNEIELLKDQATEYRKQKRGLMQKLLTGQWRIKNMESCNGP